jgi:hypothetical protein
MNQKIVHTSTKSMLWWTHFIMLIDSTNFANPAVCEGHVTLYKTDVCTENHCATVRVGVRCG